MNSKNPVRKNPSREVCEQIIRRILFTELSEHGKNSHFKQASDFMGYFESLYPASDGLTKQVQRAVRALQMPKDENGYFIPNKTALQLKQEQELSRLFQQSSSSLQDLSSLCFCSWMPLLWTMRSICLSNAIPFGIPFKSLSSVPAVFFSIQEKKNNYFYY